MSRIFSLLVITMVVGLLTACGPIYETQYAYVPPHSNMGKMCVANCTQGKSMCEQMCQMRKQQCLSDARRDAREDYREYKYDRHREGQAVKKDERDFDRSYRCNEACNCAPQFNSCYAACGGQVLEKQVCVAFCDKQ